MALLIERYLLKTMSMFVVDNISWGCLLFLKPHLFFQKVSELC